MPLLNEYEFGATFGAEMHPVEPEGDPPVDFWPYFDAIPSEDFGGYDCAEGAVDWIYRDAAGRFEHILVNSEHPEVYMVIVLDLEQADVVGHHLLYLPQGGES